MAGFGDVEIGEAMTVDGSMELFIPVIFVVLVVLVVEVRFAPDDIAIAPVDVV